MWNEAYIFVPIADFLLYITNFLITVWLEGSNNFKWWLYFEILGPKIATPQLLQVTLNAIVVALAQEMTEPWNRHTDSWNL